MQTVEANGERREKLLLLGTHAAHLVHDWNNFLTLLQAQAVELPPGAATEALLGAIGEASAVPRQLLAYLREAPAAVERIYLDEWLRGVEPTLRRLLGRQVRFFSDLAAPGAAVAVDTGQLRNALFNLTLNARAALGVHGRVRLTTAVGDGVVAMALVDNGHGIDEAVRARLFEPFFSTGDGTERTGLGLASVKAFVDRHGGALQVESAPGEGTTFTLTLPRVE
jgi:two-component system, cell cycle sensor histidine kinase and response regulator CckA